MTITKAFQTSWIIGNISVVFWAYFFRDVFKLQMVLMSPLILTLIPVYMAYESPRWLIAKGYISQASEQINAMALANGKTAGLPLQPVLNHAPLPHATAASERPILTLSEVLRACDNSLCVLGLKLSFNPKEETGCILA